MAYRVIADQTPAGAMSYQDVYGDCPESFERREDAEQWAKKLSTSGYWPDGQVTYSVEQIDEDTEPKWQRRDDNGGNMNIHEIAEQFARLAPDWLDDFGRYVGVEDDDLHSVWALDGRDVGHRIILIHQDDITALAERMRALPDGALNDERLHRGMPLFEGLLVDLE